MENELITQYGIFFFFIASLVGLCYFVCPLKVLRYNLSLMMAACSFLRLISYAGIWLFESSLLVDLKELVKGFISARN